MRIFLLALLFATVTSVTAQKKAAYPDGLYAEVMTSKGMIVMQLEFEKTPMTVASFVGLAEGTIENSVLPLGKPYYDGAKWHRVVPGHVIQCGIPANTTAGSPGYSFPNEIVFPELNHGRAGMVGMANGGAHTNGSQWYITLGDRSYLDPDYTVFGHVVKGLDVAPAITQDDVITTVKIVRVGKAANAFHPTTASFRAMVEAMKVTVADREAKKRADDEAYIQRTWPDAKPMLRMQVVTQGQGRSIAAGDTIKLRYKAQFPGGDSFVSTSDGGMPWFGDVPEVFEYTVGTTKVTPGFDAGIVGMRKGEKRVIVVSSEQAYGFQGYYPRERKGEKRFHVSPNQIIIYEVEVMEWNKP